MKKLILLALLVLASCSAPRPLVDEDLFKNELNSAIDDGFPNSTYRVQ